MSYNIVIFNIVTRFAWFYVSEDFRGYRTHVARKLKLFTYSSVSRRYTHEMYRNNNIILYMRR